MAAMSRRPLEVFWRSLAQDMKRASDDVPDDWSPPLGSVNHVDRIFDERPLRARTGRSGEVSNFGPWAWPAFQLNFAVARSPLRRKVLEFKPVLKDRMTPRELIAFVGASASVRRNKEKRAQALAVGTREDIMLDKAPNGKVSGLLNALDKALSAGARAF
jgi:hypothetical protein